MNNKRKKQLLEDLEFFQSLPITLPNYKLDFKGFQPSEVQESIENIKEILEVDNFIKETTVFMFDNNYENTNQLEHMEGCTIGVWVEENLNLEWGTKEWGDKVENICLLVDNQNKETKWIKNELH